LLPRTDFWKSPFNTNHLQMKQLYALDLDGVPVGTGKTGHAPAAAPRP
jgi:hypothetical protein